ncbi:hypothetical protein DFR72_101215 [Lentzea flaviverrucosa]|uniref:Uncharacterized protein n=2 Tax=Lentzea flaviverrucosa TaxID=200379 RepID=A0A1H9HU90_9PSEU|nr:hypothetical protein DFR72_101215 [Lentzea flaviverrucosa]SEQ65845.1 hypothetical protein SAMN05216195_1021002 [Lentzea flaviverrucosa]
MFLTPRQVPPVIGTPSVENKSVVSPEQQANARRDFGNAAQQGWLPAKPEAEQDGVPLLSHVETDASVLCVAGAGTSAAILVRMGMATGERGVTFTDSQAVIVGDHNRLTVIEHFRPEQTVVSVAELEKVIAGSWALSWAAELQIADQESWLAYLLFAVFLPDCAHVVARESGTAVLPAGSSCTIRNSAGVAVGDDISAKSHIERHLDEFRAPAARLLRDKDFRDAFFAFRTGEGATELQRAARNALGSVDDLPVPPSGAPPTVALRPRGIHVRNAVGATLGVDSTLKSSLRLYFGQMRVVNH